MKKNIYSDGSFGTVEISLSQGEDATITRGSLLSHNGQVNVDTKMNSNGGGFLAAVGRALSSSEGFWITKITGLTNEAKVTIVPSVPGEVVALPVGDEQWRINDTSFLACDSNVSYHMKKQSFGKALFGTGGFFVMETEGSGEVLVSAFGNLIEVTLDGTSPYIVENSHTVAWSSSLDYTPEAASGAFGFKSGQGFMNRFEGRGKVLVQTRSLAGLAQALPIRSCTCSHQNSND
jgi:uncharacterized protein (TIGR00266 family)